LIVTAPLTRKRVVFAGRWLIEQPSKPRTAQGSTSTVKTRRSLGVCVAWVSQKPQSASQVQDPVHHLGVRGDDRTQLMAVDEFRRRRPVVPGQAGDLLDRYAVGGHQGDEGVA